MTECTQSELSFPSCKSKKVTVGFSGGHISSVGGSLLLAQADRQMGPLSSLSLAGLSKRRLVS